MNVLYILIMIKIIHTQKSCSGASHFHESISTIMHFAINCFCVYFCRHWFIYNQHHSGYFVLVPWHPSGKEIFNICFNLSPPGQTGRHFADNVFKYIFMNEKFCISIQISPKFVPKGPIDNKSALVQVMAWCRTGDKQLPEPMLTQFADAYMRHYGEMS